MAYTQDAKHRVIAEFSHEQKEGWVSIDKGFTTAKEAQTFFAECQNDPTCLRVQMSLVKTWIRQS